MPNNRAEPSYGEIAAPKPAADLFKGTCLALCWMLLLNCLSWAQSRREYIYLDGRMIAVEVSNSGSPVPILTNIDPSFRVAGSGQFTLAVTGSSFVSGSVVHWNNSPRATTYISSTELSAAIAGSDIEFPGTASVKVVNPGDGSSQPLSFAVTTDLPPIISQVTASAGVNSATISWQTNEPADSQVEYGTSTAYGNSTTIDTNLVTLHSQVIGGLVPYTTYHYRVKSKDASGNPAVSGDNRFTTGGGGQGLTITITSPPNNSSFSSTPIQVTGNTSGGITSVSYYRQTNGGLEGMCTGIASWECSVIPNVGYNLVTITARDAMQNEISASVFFTYDAGSLPTPTMTNAYPGGVWFSLASSASYFLVDRYPGSEYGNTYRCSTSGGQSTFCPDFWPITPGITYMYRVCTTDSTYQYRGPECTRWDIATAYQFLPQDPLRAQLDVISAGDVTSLRSVIAAGRALAEVEPANPNWTDSSLAGVPVKAIHLMELRQYLNEALDALLIGRPDYTDQVTYGTLIKAIHIQEIRNVLK
jgi:hypothetical protein